MKFKKLTALFLCLAFLLVSFASALAAQGEPALQLALVRNFGYGGFTKIQGDFTLKINDPPTDLREVSFFVDDELLAVDSSSPFQAKFHTADFQPGEHRLTAQGVLESGGFVSSNAITKTFLTSGDAWSETSGIVIPLLVGTGVLTLLGLGLPLLMSRRKEFVFGQYGAAGGAVCPRCGLPFSRPALAPNLAVGKLVRCPHCGKVSVLARASAQQLEEAERKYSDTQGTATMRAKAEDRKKELEDSRFEG